MIHFHCFLLFLFNLYFCSSAVVYLIFSSQYLMAEESTMTRGKLEGGRKDPPVHSPLTLFLKFSSHSHSLSHSLSYNLFYYSYTLSLSYTCTFVNRIDFDLTVPTFLFFSALLTHSFSPGHVLHISVLHSYSVHALDVSHGLGFFFVPVSDASPIAPQWWSHHMYTSRGEPVVLSP